MGTGGYLGSRKVSLKNLFKKMIIYLWRLYLLTNALLVLRLCVRVVTSKRGGLGKTLYVRRLTDQLQNLVNNDMVVCRDSGISLHVTVPLHGNSTDSSMLVDSLLPHATRANVPLSRVFHLDVAPSVRHENWLFVSIIIPWFRYICQFADMCSGDQHFRKLWVKGL